MLITILPGL